MSSIQTQTHRAICWLVATAFAASSASADEPRPVRFARDVLPLLGQSCFRCHGGRDAKSGIRLDQRSELLGTHTSNPLVVPGDSAASRMIEAVSGTDPELVMPPKGPRLNAEQIAILRKWIDAGMEWDEDLLPEEDGSDHWAFQPITRPRLAAPERDGWSANPVDSFVSRQHREHGLHPAKRADRRALIRRLYLDMLGVPPTFEATRAFVADGRPDSWERLVDRVLASPQYGERWGRHWLDVARWAESEGYEENNPRPSAWRYRDYVIASFNQDRPIDEFIRQQIAGDEMQPYFRENLIATGFLASARLSCNQEDTWFQRNIVNVDVVNAVANAFLGLTLQCCQCHDHKFDPISTRDFYRLQAFFVRGQPVPVRLPSTTPGDFNVDQFHSLRERKEAIFQDHRQRYRYGRLSERFAAEEIETLKAILQTPADERSLEQELLARKVEVQITKDVGSIETSIQGEVRTEYYKIKETLKGLEKTIDRAFVFYSPVTSPHSLDVLDSPGPYPLPFDKLYFQRMQPYVMGRGEVHSVGDRVNPGWPAVFEQSQEPDASIGQPDTAERTRTELARWLTDRTNPLVARVWINRMWKWHYGGGLVASVDDFGFRGTRPTHPKLLDWLASELIDSDWSARHIHRLILTSQTYRLSSLAGPETMTRDPENTWLTRWTPRRLEVEVIRDSLLAVSGELDNRLGGPSVPPKNPKEPTASDAEVPPDNREFSSRRSIYLFQHRGHPAQMQGLFDGPNECSASSGDREVSTTPIQALYLLNGKFSMRAARALAGEIQGDENTQDEMISAAFRRVLQREPSERERRWSMALLDEVGSGSEDGTQAPSPLALLCQSLMNLNEFAYLE